MDNPRDVVPLLPLAADSVDSLADALSRVKVQTGSLACLGCGHEHNCGIHGCALIGKAVKVLRAVAELSRGEEVIACQDTSSGAK
nr:MAG TPA: hypothetical protein [Bacteriophage sp.]